MNSITSFSAVVAGYVIGLVGVIISGLAALLFLGNTLDVSMGRPIESYIPILVIGVFGVSLIYLAIWLRDQPNREEALRRQELEATAKLAAEQAAYERDCAEQEAEYARCLAEAENAIFTAQFAAAELSVILGEAELWLDCAQRNLAEKLPSPFWEAMEEAALCLSDFDNNLQVIDGSLQEYDQLAEEMNGEVPEFNLGLSVFPDPAAVNQRIKMLFRRGQKTRGFPMIYEQRRTNTILTEGFRSLGLAIANLGEQLQAEIASLGDELDVRLSSLESALRDSASQLAEQHFDQLEAAEAARTEFEDTNAEIAQIARERFAHAEQRANESRDYEKMTLQILDQIRNRRS